MKKLNFYLSFIAVLALLFTSCSKDEESGGNLDSENATLSFGAIVQDLANKSANKQSDIGDLPACTDDSPAYVEIVLMQGDNEVVGSVAEPFQVNLVAGQVFTEEVPELELEPGTYSLEHFAVYNDGGDLIWLAPKGGVLAEFVDNALPLDINLGAGVKKYVDVSVICYDDRDVNQYGYMFFELDANRAFEYCFFANYCTPEGRHFPARYSVDISIDGNTIYSGVENTTGTNEDGDFYADPLCFALPDLEEYGDNEEYIDYTITLLDWDDAYGDVEQMVITGSLSRAEIMANLNDDGETVEYDHLRFGCGDDNGETPVDSDNDGVVDSIDECPNTAAGVDVDEVGCPIEETDSDNDGVVDSIDECPNTPAGVDVDEVGCPLEETDSDNDGVVDSIDECPNTAAGVAVDEVGCPIQVADCIPNPVTGCSTSDVSEITLSEDFRIVEEVYGDITLRINESGDLTVGVTPVAPYEITDLQVYLPGESFITCATTTDPDEGVITTIEGDFSADLPFDVEIKVNYCNVAN